MIGAKDAHLLRLIGGPDIAADRLKTLAVDSRMGSAARLGSGSATACSDVVDGEVRITRESQFAPSAWMNILDLTDIFRVRASENMTLTRSIGVAVIRSA